MLLFNPIRLRDKLVDAGVMEREAAEVFATIISESDVVELATKADVAELKAGQADLRGEFTTLRGEFAMLKADFARLEARLMRWMMAGAGIGGLVGGLTAGLLK